MTDPMFRLGTRNSPLAMAQAEETRTRIAAAMGIDLAAIALVPVLASGDKVLDRPLAEIGGKALWTKELDAWLLSGEIDAAVHSAKDVETVRPDGLTLAAVLPREDVRDVLVGAESLIALPQGARIGTSAPRRAAQMLHHRPDCQIVPMRGNVATRLGKLAAGDADATLLAAAGLNRLGQAVEGVRLNAQDWLPAAGQGAIVVECRQDNAAAVAALAKIDHAPSRRALLAERALLYALGGNCHSPVAVLTTEDGGRLILRAALFSSDGKERVEASLAWRDDHAASAYELATKLLGASSAAIKQHFTGL